MDWIANLITWSKQRREWLKRKAKAFRKEYCCPSESRYLLDIPCSRALLTLPMASSLSYVIAQRRREQLILHQHLLFEDAHIPSASLNPARDLPALSLRAVAKARNAFTLEKLQFVIGPRLNHSLKESGVRPETKKARERQSRESESWSCRTSNANSIHRRRAALLSS
jgi:hypothetical protein